MRPTRCGSCCQDKTGRLKIPQPIWPFNTRGLPNAPIAEPACELLPHIFTITARCLRTRGYLVFCGTVCYKCIPALYPPFQVADYPVLPGLSSAGMIPRRQNKLAWQRYSIFAYSPRWWVAGNPIIPGHRVPHRQWCNRYRAAQSQLRRSAETISPGQCLLRFAPQVHH